jgi:hypothetical protein
MPEKFDFEKDNIEDEENAQFEQYMADHPEIKEEKEYMRECGPEIEKFKELIALFESKHSLSELNAIKKLTPEEARMHPVREPARLDLIPIVALLNTLQNETNISPEQFDELKFGEYMTLSRAVGMINNNKVDHDR